MQRRVFLSVLVVALMGVFSVANAQEEKKGKGRGGDVMKAALEKANLSDDQKAKVEEINKASEEAMKAARESKDREAIRAAMTKHQESIMAVLNDEQKEVVKKYIAEARAARGEKGDRKKKAE